MAWRNEDEKKEFLQLVSGGVSVKTACVQFRIHETTGHRWIKASQSVANKRTRIPRRERINDEVIAAIRRKVWEDPGASARHITTALSESGMPISETSVQKWLNANGLGSVSDRLQFVEREALGTGKRPTPAAWRRLREGGSTIEVSNFRVAWPGDVIAVTSFQWSRKILPDSHLTFALDLYSGTVRAALWEGKYGSEPIQVFNSVVQFLGQMRVSKSRQVLNDDTPCSDKVWHFNRLIWVDSSIYPSRKKERLRETAADNAVQYVQKLLEKDLLSSKKFLDCSSHKERSLALINWESNYNLFHENPHYPNYGTPPFFRVRGFTPPAEAEC